MTAYDYWKLNNPERERQDTSEDNKTDRAYQAWKENNANSQEESRRKDLDRQ